MPKTVQSKVYSRRQLKKRHGICDSEFHASAFIRQTLFRIENREKRIESV